MIYIFYIDFKIRKYSWNAGNAKWDLISSINYNNQGVNQFIDFTS
jgi:exonuclease I